MEGLRSGCVMGILIGAGGRFIVADTGICGSSGCARAPAPHIVAADGWA